MASDALALGVARVSAAVAAPLLNIVLGEGGSSAGGDTPVNPAFPLTMAGARAALEEMRREPRPLVRPVVVCAGIFDPGPGSRHVAGVLRSVTTTPELVVEASFWGQRTFDACRAHVLRLARRVWNKGTARREHGVDAIGVSMGGLVSRFAAASPAGDGEAERLPVRRLFTLGSPHHGAAWWDRAPWDGRASMMRPGGAFMADLDAAWRDPARGGGYEIVAYVRLGDQIVGEWNSRAPDGRVWWLGNPLTEFAHLQAFGDARLLADIARAVRGEPRFSDADASPLPGRNGL